MRDPAPEFSLPNVTGEPNPFALRELPATIDFVVVFFQRDHYCTNCRQQVQDIVDKYDAFQARNTEVVSILPEPVQRVESWQDNYDLPYPLLADPDASVGEAFNQPVRFGPLGKVSDFFGRMPKVIIIDNREKNPAIVYVHEGSSTFDRPDLDELLSKLDGIRGESTDAT